uniref:Uncharacterized protein n=1 Tax=Knipowitschia caucasica TaxID=637954 RepID=A0AAV2IXB3_KNICA
MAEPRNMSKTRSTVNIYDADIDFPPAKNLQPPTKLPTMQSVISVIQYHLEMRVTTTMAVRKVINGSSVKKTYTEEVLNSVSDVAAEHLDEVKKLIALMQPHLKSVLARQRSDSGIDETFPMDYPVSDQACDIDGTPVHNIGMEKQCGKVEYRLKKLGFKATAQAKREVELNWSKLVKAKLQSGAEQKQEMAQRKKRKRLDLLDILKSRGGPFTDSGEVEKFLVDESLNNIAQLQRMRLEVQFARESTKLLPKADPISRIQSLKFSRNG